MDIRTYTAFATVAGLQNITRAAERLNQTQSALSRQIKALEAHLGVRLIEKAGRNIRLTAQGEALHAQVQAVLHADRALHALVEGMSHGRAGVLRVGACSQLIERYMSGFLGQWQRQNPGVEVRLEDGGGPELADRLREGQLHLTISAAPPCDDPTLERVQLGALGFLAVATPDLMPGGMEAPGQVEIAALVDRPILTLNRRHASREVFDAACRVLGASPRITLEAQSPHTLFAMAEGGNGIAVVPSCSRPVSDRLISRAITLRGAPVRVDICAMWDGRTVLPAYAGRFVTDLGDHIRATAQPARLHVV